MDKNSGVVFAVIS